MVGKFSQMNIPAAVSPMWSRYETTMTPAVPVTNAPSSCEHAKYHKSLRSAICGDKWLTDWLACMRAFSQRLHIHRYKWHRFITSTRSQSVSKKRCWVLSLIKKWSEWVKIVITTSQCAYRNYCVPESSDYWNALQRFREQYKHYKIETFGGCKFRIGILKEGTMMCTQAHPETCSRSPVVSSRGKPVR